MLSFVLASASPARRKLLQMAGIEPIVCVSDFDESLVQSNDTIALVQTLAMCKAQTVAPQFSNALILGCDSVLEVDGKVYGKPQSPEEAIARWRKMRGNQGILYTGHALIDQRQQRELIHCGITNVYFANISDETIIAYVNTGEPLNCAGCFALEGKEGYSSRSWKDVIVM